MHNLLHLYDDVENLGSLEKFSAFPFENYTQSIKKKLRKKNQPLAQIVRRITEEENCSLEAIKSRSSKYPYLRKEHQTGPIISMGNCSQYKELHLENFLLTISEPDNCCHLKNGNIISICNFIVMEEQTVVVGKKFLKRKSFFFKPYPSAKKRMI